MTLVHILVFALAALPFMWGIPAAWRPWGLMLGSLAAVAWLISDGLFTHLDLMLLMLTLLLVVAVWWAVSPERTQQDNIALLLMTGFVLVVAFFTLPVLLLLAGLGGVGAFSVARLVAVPEERNEGAFQQLAAALIVLIIIVLVVLKVPALAGFFGFVLVWEGGALAVASPLIWLGFSYMAFRLIGMLLDYRAGRLPVMGLRDVATYVLFFPAFTAGPIDRAQRFIPEVMQAKPLDADRLMEGMMRIAIGAFKKFVIADSLALVSMNPVLIDQTQTTVGLWLLLYLYALQIFFDFSGYSNVAIGIGRLYGITLPENFNRPYLQPNIQQFWQRWHITLSTWFRVYYFMPLSRMMLRSRYKLPQWAMIFIAQITTMLLIGLWHGATLNFFLWGLWHGVGLFLHKLLADNTKQWTRRVNARRWSRWVMYAGSVFTTFHFVALGWVFFALPGTADSLKMLLRLFGMGVGIGE